MRWVLWASAELGLLDRYRIGFGGPGKTGLGGPVRNWAWWANTELGLVGQYETGLGVPVRNWACWANT